MKRRIVALLLALCLALLPAMGAMAEEEELFFSGNDLTQDKTESSDDSAIDSEKNQSASILESLGQKDWNALADAVKLTGDWRDDLVAVAESQVGYTESKDGMTVYTEAAGKKAGSDWTALFVNWVAEKAGLSSREFPRGDSYKALRSAMNKVGAVKKISRSSYPTAGDLAFIDAGSTKLVGIVTYVSNGYASMIVADVNGRVVKDTYAVSKNGFNYYADMNVLMERAGIEVGKGGEVPYIPEGGLAAWTNTNAVYMRSEPTTASSRVTTIKKAGTAMVVLSGEMQADGYIWYAVKYGKYSGFIRGDLLDLDMEASQAAMPTAMPAPTATPAPTMVPGCALCAREADGMALPVECCYEHLKSMGAQESYKFMSALLEDDYITFMLYVNCHNDHVLEGADPVICWSGCEQSIFTPVKPGAEHSEGCGWYAALSAEERVVNIVVTEPVDASGVSLGKQVIFTYEVYGAQSYQWYQKDPLALDAYGEPAITMLTGQTGTTLTVTASAENDGCIYYCEATLSDDYIVTSKPVTLTVAASKVITAEAIIGEEVYFTYDYAGAAGYVWYVKAPDAADFVEAAESTGAKITLTAEQGMSGAIYYAEALDSKGNVLGTSAQYSYVISTDYAANLCKYVEELAGMTRAERFEIMTGMWNINVDIDGVATTLADAVKAHWQEEHDAVYPTLLCTCDELQSPSAGMHINCPWGDATTSKNERANADPCDAQRNHLPNGLVCVYDFLQGLSTPEARYIYLHGLYGKGATTYSEFISLYESHIADGQAQLLCSCYADSNQLMYGPNDPKHADGCTWEQGVLETSRVLGAMMKLSVLNGVDTTGYTFQWYKVTTVDGVEVTEAVEGANEAAYKAMAELTPAGYYCVYSNGQGVTGYSTMFMITPYLDPVDYLDELYSYESDLFADETGYVDSHQVYQMMTGLWNIEVNGSNLAVDILEQWWSEHDYAIFDPTMMCSCMLDENGQYIGDGSVIMYSPGSDVHMDGCGWAKPVISSGTFDVSTPEKLQALDGQSIILTSSVEGAEDYLWQQYVYDAEENRWYWESITYDNSLTVTISAQTIATAYRCETTTVMDNDYFLEVSKTFYLGGYDFFSWIQNTEGVLAWMQDASVTLADVVARYNASADEEDRINAEDYTYGEEGESVNLKVPTGTFAEDYVMEIAPATLSDATINAVLQSMDATGTAQMQVLTAFDIAFAALADRTRKLQPAEGTSVALTFEVDTTGIDEALKYLYVYHIANDGTPEVVAGPVDAALREIQVEADAFSVYAVVLSSDSCAYCTGTCVYEELIAGMSDSEMYAHLEAMDEEARKAYLNAYDLHIAAGDPEVLCNCKDLLTELTNAGADHATTCPWHSTYSVHTDVVGWEVSLPAPAEATEWIWTDENGNELAPNTNDHTVVVKSKPHTYYCVAKVNNEAVTYTYYVEAQTTVLSSYVNFLFSYFGYYEELKDYAAFVYNLMTSTDTEDELHWNFEVYDADGEHLYNMAEAVLSYWYQEDGLDLLCSCIVSEAVAPVDGEIMLPWDAEHVEGCPWHIPGTLNIELEPVEYDEDGNVTSYELVVYTDGKAMVVIAKSTLMRKDDNSNEYHYFQDINTGWYVAYLHEVINEDGTVTQWIIPLPSEKELEETPAN